MTERFSSNGDGDYFDNGQTITDVVGLLNFQDELIQIFAKENKILKIKCLELEAKIK